MTEVTCSRCGDTAEGLERAPLPGPAGALVLAQSCAACWKEWLATQVKLINENRLSPADPRQFDFLIAQMKIFLGLREE